MTTLPAAPPGFARVLVVDDNRDAADSAADLLRVVGFDARACYDGPSALAAADEYRPDVCLVDLNMPRMDGDELAVRLRDRLAGRPLLLVALTARGDDESRRRTAAAGFHLHLVKPVHPRHLLDVVDELGRLTGGPGPTPRPAAARPDRRAVARRTVEAEPVPVRAVSPPAGPAAARILDRSAAGVGLALGRPVEAGAVLAVRLADGDRAGWATAAVRHCRPDGRGWVAGCELLGARPACRSAGCCGAPAVVRDPRLSGLLRRVYRLAGLTPTAAAERFVVRTGPEPPELFAKLLEEAVAEDGTAVVVWRGADAADYAGLGAGGLAVRPGFDRPCPAGDRLARALGPAAGRVLVFAVERRDAAGRLLGVTWAAIPEGEPPPQAEFTAAVLRADADDPDGWWA